MKYLTTLHCSCSVNELENIISKMTWLKEIEVFSTDFVSPCLFSPLINLEKFQMILSPQVNFKPFKCSLKGLTYLKEFSIRKYDCCWPYIQLTKDEIQKIQLLLPTNCELNDFFDKNLEVKSDIELR